MVAPQGVVIDIARTASSVQVAWRWCTASRQAPVHASSERSVFAMGHSPEGRPCPAASTRSSTMTRWARSSRTLISAHGVGSAICSGRTPAMSSLPCETASANSVRGSAEGTGDAVGRAEVEDALVLVMPALCRTKEVILWPLCPNPRWESEPAGHAGGLRPCGTDPPGICDHDAVTAGALRLVERPVGLGQDRVDVGRARPIDIEPFDIYHYAQAGSGTPHHGRSHDEPRRTARPLGRIGAHRGCGRSRSSAHRRLRRHRPGRVRAVEGGMAVALRTMGCATRSSRSTR